MTKPFNPALPAQTRDGRPVRILCTDAKGDQPICGLVVGASCDTHTRWRSDGSINDKWDHSWDLINVPTKRKGWILVKPHGWDAKVIAVTSHVYASQAAAVGDNCASWQIIEIEFDE